LRIQMMTKTNRSLVIGRDRNLINSNTEKYSNSHFLSNVTFVKQKL